MTLTVNGLEQTLVRDTMPARVRGGLVGYWQASLGDSVGLIDLTGNGNTLTNNNSVAQAAGPSANLPYAASFVAASSQALDIADNASLRIPAGAFTLWGWCYPSSAAVQSTLVSKFVGANAGDFWVKLLDTDATALRVTFYNGTNNTGVDSPTGLLTDSAWHFWAAWYDPAVGANGTSYVQIDNGVVTGTAAGVIPATNGTPPFAIGRRNTGSNYFNGRQAQVGYHKRLLSAAERAWLYNNGVGRDLRGD